MLGMTPVKICAQENNIDVYQPGDINDKEVIDKLRSFDADLFVVISFGQKLSREVLGIPRFYSINVHASVLPRWRGAAPINYAITSGDEYTGITIMKMNEYMDRGDIIMSKSIEIKDDDMPALTERLAVLSGELLLHAIDRIEKNKVTFTKQDEKKATYARKLTKKDGVINWNKRAPVIHNQIRGLLPWPCAYTYYKGAFLKVLRSSLIECDEKKEKQSAPGKIIDICKKRGIIVACSDGFLLIEKLQPEGKKAMSAYDFVLGHHVKRGDFLGEKNAAA
jgi:methionyl-tRNA formyltransferase